MLLLQTAPALYSAKAQVGLTHSQRPVEAAPLATLILFGSKGCSVRISDGKDRVYWTATAEQPARFILGGALGDQQAEERGEPHKSPQPQQGEKKADVGESPRTAPGPPGALPYDMLGL